MNKLLIVIILFFCISAFAQEKTTEKQKVKLTTSYGEIIIELFNETPLHRDNFIKLVKKDFFNGLLFHRVIDGFMIQGGDPDSKNAKSGTRLGNGGPGYRIPAEFKSELIHRKGVLAAAREGDQVNPKKESSGSQFYIAQGKVYTPQVMNQMEQKMNQRNLNQWVNMYIKKPENKQTFQLIDSLQKNQKYDELNVKFAEIEAIVKKLPEYKPFKFSPIQREAYTTVGGIPHLDGSYTVFGQVVKGLNVIDSIASQPTDKFDRPIKDIQMEMKIIK